MSKYAFSQPCIVCGTLSRAGTRCERHKAELEQKHELKRRERKRQTGQYSGQYKARARAVRQSATICHICKEGYRPYDPWQADHLIPSDPNSPLLPAHRSCNSERGNKPII